MPAKDMDRKRVKRHKYEHPPESAPAQLQTPSAIMNLPQELRYMIYYKLFEDLCVIVSPSRRSHVRSHSAGAQNLVTRGHVDWKCENVDVWPLFTTCKQVAQEARMAFFANIDFVFMRHRTFQQCFLSNSLIGSPQKLPTDAGRRYNPFEHMQNVYVELTSRDSYGDEICSYGFERLTKTVPTIFVNHMPALKRLVMYFDTIPQIPIACSVYQITFKDYFLRMLCYLSRVPGFTIALPDEDASDHPDARRDTRLVLLSLVSALKEHAMPRGGADNLWGWTTDSEVCHILTVLSKAREKLIVKSLNEVAGLLDHQIDVFKLRLEEGLR